MKRRASSICAFRTSGSVSCIRAELPRHETRSPRSASSFDRLLNPRRAEFRALREIHGFLDAAQLDRREAVLRREVEDRNPVPGWAAERREAEGGWPPPGCIRIEGRASEAASDWRKALRCMPDIIWPTVLVTVSSDGATLAAAAAADAAARLRAALKERQRARIIAATGASQFEFLGRLVREDGIDWRRVEMFHLDE